MSGGVGLRAAWQDGRVTRGVWCTVPSSVSAELLAGAGFDYVCVDLQHGAIGYGDTVPMLQAISGRGATPIVRVNANDAAHIGKVLDAGALGVVVPLVSSPAQAASAVAACRYPPRGVRSFGPVRAAGVIGSRDVAALEQVACVVMVETRQGLDEVDAIAATPGLDAIYVGPSDLSLALGLTPAYEHADPAHGDAIQAIRAACERHGIVAGIHCDSGAMAARRLSEGFRMVTVTNDGALLRSGAARELDAAAP